MKHRVLAEGSERTVVVVFESGEEVMAGLRHFAAEQRIAAARLSAIGAFSQATVGFYVLDRQEYRHIAIDEQVEALSLLGDIALKPDGKPEVHVHAVLGTADGSTRGGHLLSATVRPTLEVMLIESPAHLRRRFVPAFGLALIDLDTRS